MPCDWPDARRVWTLPRVHKSARATLLAICVALSPSHVMAATEGAQTHRIRIEYVPPSDPAHQSLYELLQQRRALEKVQQIFSPFRLPSAVTVKTAGCDGVANAFYQRGQVTICYEYLDEIRKNMPKETTPAGITPTDAVAGQFFYVVAHEMGHAVFDLLVVPIWGGTEQAADQFAAFLMLQFGRDEARRLIGGAAFSFKGFMDSPKVIVPLEAFSSAHGAPMQRFFNLLCIAYGADSRLFADVVEKGFLPQSRVPRCRPEYREVAFAFRQLVAAHLDQELAREVLDRSWLPDGGLGRSGK